MEKMNMKIVQKKKREWDEEAERTKERKKTNTKTIEHTLADDGR